MKSAGPLIVQVVPYYPPHLGGMEVVARSLAEGLAQTGPVLVLTSRSGADGAPHVERHGNLVVRRLATVEGAHLPLMPTLLFHLLRVPRGSVIHAHVAQAYTPEMVWLASVLRRQRFIAHFHLDVEPSGRLGPLFNLYKRHILGRTLRAAARVVVLTTAQGTFLEDRYGVESANISTLPNGVAPEFFTERGAAMQPADAPMRLLFVGRLAPQKNLPRLLEAMALVTARVDLIIVGDGEERVGLERLRDQLGLTNVTMVGAQRGQDLIARYRSADAFVLPSDREGGMPLVILEAMAAGLPIIATDVFGTRDTMAQDGILVQPSPSALAEAIDRVAADPGLRAELSRRSRRRARAHTWPAVLGRLESVYDIAGAP